MQIPQSYSLSTSTMNRVFDKTVATYKFYWLLSLLDMHIKEQRTEMLALDIASRMVAYAWYPIEFTEKLQISTALMYFVHFAGRLTGRIW